MLVSFAACRPSIPCPDLVSNAAVGTFVPGGHEASIDVSLPPEMGGVLFVNQTSFPIQVIVNNTIALYSNAYLALTIISTSVIIILLC
jgi:hypothetical protein